MTKSQKAWEKIKTPPKEQDWLTAAVPLPGHKGAPAAYCITRRPEKRRPPFHLPTPCQLT